MRERPRLAQEPAELVFEVDVFEGGVCNMPVYRRKVPLTLGNFFLAGAELVERARQLLRDLERVTLLDVPAVHDIDRLAILEQGNRR